MSLQKWTFKNKKILSKTSIFDLVSTESKPPHSKDNQIFYRLECPDWVNILPITPDGQVLLIRQFRVGIEDLCLEIPGGILEKNETPEQAALRELEEETGYTTTPNHLTSLGYVWPNPAIQNNRCYLFFAEQVQPTGKLHWDAAEDIEIIVIPYEEFLIKISNNEMKHAIILTTAIKYDLFRRDLLRP